MRELQLWARQESVDRIFDDVTEIPSACQFRNCSHSGESGCAVAVAIAEGVVSGERWKSYRKLKRHEETTGRIAAAERKKKVKSMHKSIRTFYRKKDDT